MLKTCRNMTLAVDKHPESPNLTFVQPLNKPKTPDVSGCSVGTVIYLWHNLHTDWNVIRTKLHKNHQPVSAGKNPSLQVQLN